MARLRQGPSTVEILVPEADRTGRPAEQPVAARVNTLHGARLGFVDNTFLAVRVLHRVIARALDPLGIVRIDARKKYWRPLAGADLDRLERETIAVVGSLVNTSPSAIWSARDAIALEARGRPTVTFVTAYFADLFAETAAAEGMPGIRRIVLPSSVEELSDEALGALGTASVPHVVAALTRIDAPAIVAL